MRHLWKFLGVVALCLATIAGGAAGAAADPGETPPPRNNSSNETVYLVKGFNPDPTSDGVSCNARWKYLINASKRWGWKKKQFTQVGFYKGDYNCDINLASSDGTWELGLEELGRRLAWNIYLNHSVKGESVDLVGHSMGGLIIRAAVLGTQQHKKDWPDYIYVEDAVTLGTPHYGTFNADVCVDTFPTAQQCEDITPGSYFSNWLTDAKVPQSRQGTDWTFIGSQADESVSPRSATPTDHGAPHLVRYDESAGISHSELRIISRGAKPMRYSNDGGQAWRHTTRGAAPLRATSHALYWSSAW
ncbi:esterase/lipase family protein [Streptomyces sp. NPDC002889]|uniref:esterase/lipase family protein n=1 Tax=Streptomyces sp. NPDC002889 TaxID=3364669 RepID=UPI00368E69F0